MDLKDIQNKSTHNEDVDEDIVELPPDTLAILNEFLCNKSIQESSESDRKVFGEDWVI